MDTTTLFLLCNPYLSNPSSVFIGETLYRLLPVASSKTLSFQHRNSNLKAYTAIGGGSLSLRRGLLGRAFREDEFSTRTSDRSSKREKLIALFKRIQFEISEGESGSGTYSSFQASIDDDSSVETSVLEFLQQSNWENKGKDSKLKHSKESSLNRKTAEKEIAIPIPQPSSTTNFTRPPSNFVKKSPIPSPTALRSNEIEVNNREESSCKADKESSKVEGMKLTELKELAKKRGIRGYSKLRKSELVELLKS